MTQPTPEGGHGVGHTPGPWEARYAHIWAKGSVDTYSGSVWGPIIHVLPLFANDADGRNWAAAGSVNANALLVSAAPDLLEALEDFCRRVEAGEVRSKRTYAKFKALIAKARGL